MAAVAAQAARIWAPIDYKFAKRCCAAAETAYKAAKAHPAMLANPSFDGGGPYADDSLKDEFYWAACELFITTGHFNYWKEMRQSSRYLTVNRDQPAQRMPRTPYFFLPHWFHQFKPFLINDTAVIAGSSMDWSFVSSLGKLSLAVVPNFLPFPDKMTARLNVVRQANGYLAALKHEGYGVPFAAQSGYVWGSNSNITNNMVILGMAYDFTHQVKYAAAVCQGMDYLLGRNPNDKSYISGYGDRPLEHPTHLFWARQLSPNYPPPPPGAVAGGPNPGLQDPAIGAAYGCSSPMTSYVDDIESYSTNEVAINWNAPLAWVAAFIDEHRRLIAGSSTVLGE
jgi:endoglucanase